MSSSGPSVASVDPSGGRYDRWCIIFDDLQWAEATLLDLIDDLVDAATGMTRSCFVCSARPEVLDRRPTWAGRQLKPSTVVLEALTAESLRAAAG